MNKPFWQTKSLAEMTADEWESLCDGCGKCCLVKLEDEDDGEVYFTNLCCTQLNEETCRCSDYANRALLVPDCVQLTPETIDEVSWLPSSCAYRLLNENKSLPEWHPLVSGDSQSVHKTGNSVQGRVLSEQHVHPDDIEDHIIRWVN